MNAVGIDVSKGKSTIAVVRPFGELVMSPFEVLHTNDELKDLAKILKKLKGETKIVMEYTGKYYQPIASVLAENGLFVSVVHAKLIKDYGNNTIRKVKTDKKDSLKIANYAIDNWLTLPQWSPEEDIRQTLKTYNRQYNKYSQTKTALRNNLISLLDLSFPGVNQLFTSSTRSDDGHEKWVDFIAKFWHADCVADLSLAEFTKAYKQWSKKNGYFTCSTSEIHSFARQLVTCIPKAESTKILITTAVSQLNTICENQVILLKEMQVLSRKLPEYQIVMDMYGIGDVLGVQLMAEIGDVTRFTHKQALTAYAGLDSPPNQSGAKDLKSSKISKRGNPHLRKVLFQVCNVLVIRQPIDNPVYQFLDKKRSEGKHYYCYMTAASNKFLRIYFGKVMEFLHQLDAVNPA